AVVRRRYPAAAVIVAGLVAVVGVARERPEAATPIFSVAAGGWMPSAPTVADGLTETRVCPGVPATGVEGVGGSVVIANRTGERLEGTVLVFGEGTGSTRIALDIDPWSPATIDLDATLPGEMVAAVVEIDGGGAVVEQRAFDP